MINNIDMITQYKGYTIIESWDWNFHVYDGAKYIISQETLREAQEAILKIVRLTQKAGGYI